MKPLENLVPINILGEATIEENKTEAFFKYFF